MRKHVTPKKYIKKHLRDNQNKELTEKELERGKPDNLDWDTIYTQIRGGMNMLDIVSIHGNGRLISLWAVKEGITRDKTADLIDAKIVIERKLNEIEKTNPKVSNTIKDMVNMYAPDVAMKVAKLASTTVDKAQRIMNDEDSGTNDMKNIWDTMQKMTDTVEITQRHSNANNVNIGALVTGGTEFVVDIDVKSEEDDVIDVPHEGVIDVNEDKS